MTLIDVEQMPLLNLVIEEAEFCAAYLVHDGLR